ncbi:hypothetical protein BG004_006834, partial [Podila humilis]
VTTGGMSGQSPISNVAPTETEALPSPNIPCTTFTPGNAVFSTVTYLPPASTLPRLKSRPVLFVTKAVCVQRKDELDRYLHDLFALGPAIAQSRLVAEFFGIWKTDMEVHLRHENRDPLALHVEGAGTGGGTEEPSLVSPISASCSFSSSSTPSPTDPTITPHLPEEQQHHQQQQNQPELQREQHLHHRHSYIPLHGTLEAFSPSAPPDMISHAPVPDNVFTPSTDTGVDCGLPVEAAHLSSPSCSPASNPEPLRLATYDLGHESDVEMASPTDPSPHLPMMPELKIMADGDSNAIVGALHVESVTTRTIKKFKSLRRPSATQLEQRQTTLDDSTQDRPQNMNAKATASSTPAMQVQIFANTKPKIMKRAKTIVFRPEVTVQPLSSKNVIPPWNRIPSAMGPISPVSPTSPNLPPKNDSSGDGYDSNLASHNEARPRKITMTQSKTMSSISTQPLLSMASGTSSRSSFPRAGSTPSSTVTSPTQSASSSGFMAPDTAMSRGGMSSASSLSFSIPPASTLVAPWNRTNSKIETSTHMHSLIKVSGQPSPSLQSPAMSSPFIPVEISKSVKKKQQLRHQQLQSQSSLASVQVYPGRGMSKLATVPTNMKDYLTEHHEEFNRHIHQLKNSTVPAPTQPHRSRTRTNSGTRPARSTLQAAAGSSPAITRSQSAQEASTHSLPSSVPIMESSAPPELVAGNLQSDKDDTLVADYLHRKRTPRRESGSVPSPIVSAKQPVSILKNSGGRKASLTIPAPRMTPSSSPLPTPATSPGSDSKRTKSLTGNGGNKHRSGSVSVVTTFKIVMDADTIVALQIVEESKSRNVELMLTIAELRSRIEAKLLKSNIQLPAAFDMVWKPTSLPSIASSCPSTPLTPFLAMSPVTPTTTTSTTKKEDMSDSAAMSLVLKTDADLQQAIQGSPNRKVTLRCIF